MSRNISFKFAAILLVGITILIGCTPNSDDYRKHDDPVPVEPDVPEDPVSYAERILGTTIDPNQDWVLTSACSVTVTADANLDNISTVAVLEGNPYAGDSYVMVSKAATRDEKVSLSFLAPQGEEYLYAACISSDGKSVARAFVPGEETMVTFQQPAPVSSASAAALRRADVQEPPMVIVSNPTYKYFDVKDFTNFRNALFQQLPEKQDNRSKFPAECDWSTIRIKQNEYNFYELPFVFLGGIGKDNFASDNDNLLYYWGPKNTSSQARFLLKDHFKNAFQPKYDSETKTYSVEGIYMVGNDQSGQQTTQLSADKVDQDKLGLLASDYYAISIATKGQDPHGIVIPGRWQWPTEKTCITKAYLKFADWAHDIKNPTA